MHNGSKGKCRVLVLALFLQIAGLVPGVVVMGPSQAQAQDLQEQNRARALELYREGRDAYRAKKFAEAVEKFQAAQKLSPNPKLFLFIARAYDKLGNHVGEVLRYLELYSASSPEARAEVQDLLNKTRSTFQERLVVGARSRVMQALAVASSNETSASMPQVENPDLGGTLFDDVPFSVYTKPLGASVYVDDKEWGVQGETPANFPLFPGDYTLIVEKEYYEPLKVRVKVHGLAEKSEPQSITLEMKRQQVPVSVFVKPSTATIVYLGEDGSLNDLGEGSWSGHLPAGKGTFIVKGNRDLESRYDELLLRSKADETGRMHLEFDVRSKAMVKVDDKLTGSLEVSTYLLGGKVFVDGREVGETPGKVKATVSPGLHSISLRREGFKPWTQNVHVKGGEMVPVSAPEFLEPVEPPGSGFAAWALTSTGVAALGAGGFFTYQGTQKSGSDADTQNLISYICYGVGGVSLGTGMILFLTGGSEDARAERDEDARDLRLGLIPLQGGMGVTFGLGLD